MRSTRIATLAMGMLVATATLGSSQSLESVLPGFWVYRIIAEVNGGDPDATPRAESYESTVEFRPGGTGAEHVADVTLEFTWRVLDERTVILRSNGIEAELWFTWPDPALLYAIFRNPDDPTRFVFASYTRYPRER